MRIINLTPHALHIRRVDRTDITIEPSGIVPRLEASREVCAPVTCEDGVEIAVSRATFGALTGMPEPHEICEECDGTGIPAEGHNCPGCYRSRFGGTIPTRLNVLGDHHNTVIFVVSALCAQSPELAARNDVYAPGEALRDASGKIVGSQGLSYIVPIGNGGAR
jgi:hypothetical protein